MRAVQTEAGSKPQQSPAVGNHVESVMEFFSTRLLLKRFRRGGEAASDHPPAVAECEAAFKVLATEAATFAAQSEPLDAVTWADRCLEFSERWLEVSHWISPKKLREFLSARIGAQWRDEDAVPPEREVPPRDLKWYKNPDGVKPAKPCVCPLCGVVCNSAAQFRAHSQGVKHRGLARMHGLSTPPPSPEAADQYYGAWQHMMMGYGYPAMQQQQQQPYVQEQRVDAWRGGPQVPLPSPDCDPATVTRHDPYADVLSDSASDGGITDSSESHVSASVASATPPPDLHDLLSYEMI